MPFIDPANPSPWLASLSASRRRRAEAARQVRRKRAGRGGGAVLLAAMTLVAGGAVAADGPAARSGRVATVSGVAALQRALGVSADGVIGPHHPPRHPRYQRNHGLMVDGVAGPATLPSLGIAAASAKAHGTGRHPRRLEHARQDRPVRVRRRSDRGLLDRPLPRQVPVLARHLARRSAAPAIRRPRPRPSRTRWRPSCSPSAGTSPWPVCGALRRSAPAQRLRLVAHPQDARRAGRR